MDDEVFRQEFKALFGSSNGILGDLEEPAARELLHDAYDAVPSLNAEILSVEGGRAQEYEWLRSGASPREQIPPEILGQIFKFCVADNIVMVDIPPHPHTQSLVLSHVCSRWRHMALAEPGLWNIVLVGDPSTVRPDTLEAILSRAGNAITLCMTMVHIAPPVLRIIHQYSDKFQSVELSFIFLRGVEYFDVPFAQLGALQKLAFSAQDRRPYDYRRGAGRFQFYRAISAFANSSNLHQLDFALRLDGAHLDLGTPIPLHFPWSHLERLTIACYMSLAEFFTILAQCTQLVSCEASVDCNELYDTLVPGSVTPTPKNLSSLTLVSCIGIIDRALGFLVTPLLQVLKLKNTCVSSNALLCFIQQSKCNIQTLDVALISIPLPAVQQLLLAIPGVVRLTLRAPVVNDTILDSVAMGALLSNVEVLECCVSSCRATQKLVSNRCGPRDIGPRGMMQKFTAWVPRQLATEEWRGFQASLPQDGAVQITFGQPII